MKREITIESKDYVVLNEGHAWYLAIKVDDKEYRQRISSHVPKLSERAQLVYFGEAQQKLRAKIRRG
jgi:hypothetical protein